MAVDALSPAFPASLSSPATHNLAAAVRRSSRADRRLALMLALPALLFILVTFVAPILSLLGTSLGNPEVRHGLPQTLAALKAEPAGGVPSEAVFSALAADLAVAHRQSAAAGLGKRLNLEYSGARSLFSSTARGIDRLKPPFREAFLAHDKAWSDPTLWQVIRNNDRAVTPFYLLQALDLKESPQGGIERVAGDEAIFLGILGRTLAVAGMVTLATLILGYPVAYMLSIAPARIAGIMMLMVLLPLWTSLLVRTTAWVVLLQSNGVINDVLIALHLTSEHLQLIFTRFGTVLAMTHIQLPFTLLPIYSVMRTIPATHLRAARSLGASPLSAFWRVYAPQTVPGVVAGSLMTFILSLGYYITPALVGGPRDQMLSNFISTYINRDLNWSFAAALGVVLLVVTLAIYGLFLRLVGADKIKLG